MIRDVEAKTLLSRVRGDDHWFGLYYNMNLYRGCQHQCVYCDSRSECYQIEDFDHDVLVKINSIDLLRRELQGKRMIGTIGTGSMNDPYMPLEKERRLTRQALQVIAEYAFPVHTITKSDLVLRDRDLFQEIGDRSYAAVTFTVTTYRDDLSRMLEPGAPVSSRRFAALKELRRHGILAGITMMPILPFIEDSRENIARIVENAAESDACYILPAFGMTLRDRQRSYYFARLECLFPGLRQQYQRTFGDRYSAGVQNAAVLAEGFHELCRHYAIPTRMPVFTAVPRQRTIAGQMPLL